MKMPSVGKRKTTALCFQFMFIFAKAKIKNLGLPGDATGRGKVNWGHVEKVIQYESLQPRLLCPKIWCAAKLDIIFTKEKRSIADHFIQVRWILGHINNHLALLTIRSLPGPQLFLLHPAQSHSELSRFCGAHVTEMNKAEQDWGIYQVIGLRKPYSPSTIFQPQDV